MLFYGVPFMTRQRRLSHRYLLQTLQEATRGLDPTLSHGLYWSSASQRSLKRQPPGTQSSITLIRMPRSHVTQTLARCSGAVLCRKQLFSFNLKSELFSQTAIYCKSKAFTISSTLSQIQAPFPKFKHFSSHENTS